MQDAFGVARDDIVSKSNPFTYKDSKDRTRVDTPTNLALAGGAGATAGLVGGEAAQGVKDTRASIKGMSTADNLQWRSLSRAKRAKDAVSAAANPAFRALKKPSTAIAIGGTAAAMGAVGVGAKKFNQKKKTPAMPVAKRDSAENTAAAAGGAAAGGGALAVGRKRWNADNLHPNSHTPTERAIWSSKVLPKSAQTRTERALALIARPSAGKVGNLSKPKMAAVVGGSAAVAGGTAAGVNAARKNKKGGRPHL